jgi:hypothetical protein
MREYQRRPAEIPDDVRDRHRLAGSSNTKERLEPIAALESPRQFRDSVGLVTRRFERRP